MKKTLVLAAGLLLSLGALANEDITGINIDIANPMTIVIKHAKQQRFSRLVRFYEPGIVGQLKNGDLAVRDGSRLTLVQRQTAEKLIDADNSDRQALIASVAQAYKREDAIPAIRAALAKRWADEMKSGWWLQDEQGNWIKKP